jgi:hypothetical protein
MDFNPLITTVGKYSDNAEKGLGELTDKEGNIDPAKMLSFQMQMNQFTQLLGTTSDTMSALNSSMSKLSQNVK